MDTVVKAYNEHLHLEIRADDVWLTILAQFSIYVNEHAEECVTRVHFLQLKLEKADGSTKASRQVRLAQRE